MEVLVIGTRWRGTTPESGGFLYLMLGHHIKEFLKTKKIISV